MNAILAIKENDTAPYSLQSWSSCSAAKINSLYLRSELFNWVRIFSLFFFKWLIETLHSFDSCGKFSIKVFVNSKRLHSISLISFCVKFWYIAGKIGLEWFGPILGKLWSENVQKFLKYFRNVLSIYFILFLIKIIIIKIKD